MKNFICLALLTVALVHIAFAQKDSTEFKPRFALFTDVVLDVLNEKNIGFEVKTNPLICLGASMSFIKPFEGEFLFLHKDVFIANQEFNPGRVYNGFSVKAILKWYAFKKSNQYLGVNPIFKKGEYDTSCFSTGNKESYISFCRANERASFLGVDFLYGVELLMLKYVYMDFFAGLGYRHRTRDYTTYESRYGQYSSHNTPLQPLGTFTVQNDYISSIVGIKMGFCFTKK